MDVHLSDYFVLISRSQLRQGSNSVVFFPTVTGLATKTIHQGAPLPAEHSKNYDSLTIVHGIGCSLNLNISYYCSSVSRSMGRGLLSMCKQSIRKTCRCYKKLQLLGWDP